MNIKDSGQRRTFSTGAQRDRATGKGRMDLIPWNAIREVASVAYTNFKWEQQCNVSWHLSLAMEYGGNYLAGWNDQDYLAKSALEFLYALESRYKIAIGESTDIYEDEELRAPIEYIDNEGHIDVPYTFLEQEDWIEGLYDLLPWNAIMEVSKICEGGAIKYGARNCEKGMPIDEYLDSGLRHGAKSLAGWRDENHMAQAAWNMLFALETRYQIAIGELPPELGIMARQRVEPLENVGEIERNPDYWEAA